MDTSPVTKMKNTKDNLPCECFACGSSKGWTLKHDVQAMEVKDEMLDVAGEFYACNDCGYEMMTPAQLKADLLAATKAYQKKHKLLTAEEVVSRRNALGLSQDAFCAQAKGVKPASLKRLEIGQRVQDESTDVAIASALASLEKVKEQREIIEFALHSCTPSDKVCGTWSEGFTAITKTLGIAASGCFSEAPVKTKPQRDRSSLSGSSIDITSDSYEYALGA